MNGDSQTSKVKSELAKLKASIVEEAARSCDQKVNGAKYSATSVIYT